MALPSTVRTPAQNSALWGLVAQLQRTAGLDRDDAEAVLRRHCREVSGQEHTSRLSPGQAARLIDALRQEVAGYDRAAQDARDARKPWGRRGPGPRGGQGITARQQAVIAALFDQAGLAGKARITFCQRQCKRPWPQTQAHADALIEPLVEMVLRQVDAADFRRRAEALVQHPALTAWERGFIDDLVQQFRHADLEDIDPRTVLSTHKLRKLVECEARLDGGEA